MTTLEKVMLKIDLYAAAVSVDPYGAIAANRREQLRDMMEDLVENPHIAVGEYTLRQGREDGRVWIERENGEGGDFQVDRWYRENF